MSKMENFSEEEKVDAAILKKLYLGRWIGGKHLPLRFVIQGLPNKYHALAKKRVRKIIASGILLSKPSTGEKHISINLERVQEVVEFVERVLGLEDFGKR